jgi:hypothetical protein
MALLLFLREEQDNHSRKSIQLSMEDGLPLGNASLVLLQQEWDSRGRRMARL